MGQISKIIIANRGEIALRIIKTARKMNIATVVVYAADDAHRQFVQQADEACLLEGDTLDKTYLNPQKIIELALQTGADAIHPGYGFLSENADFAQLCIENNLNWIGPMPEAMRLMSDKISAQGIAESLGIPIIASVSGSIKQLHEAAHNMPFPLIIKAAAGGGGRGMKIAHNIAELPALLELASREALQFFGNDSLFLAHYLENAKHIEVQILADQHGNVVHLFERECSVQRRHQKIIEEAPAVSISDNIKHAMYSEALLLAKTVGYSNAGTIEFMVDSNGKHYFLEMNTRIQVEHPVTEAITGIDLIEQQIRIAEGCALPFKQNDVKISGHAIECRICAEDAMLGFSPSAGILSLHNIPKGPGIRIDSDIDCGTEINTNYDSMLSKLIVYGQSRSEARKNAANALHNYHIHGIETNIAMLCEILQHPQFAENSISTRFLDLNEKYLTENIIATKQNVNRLHPVFSAIVVWLYGKNEPSNSNIWQTIGFWRQLPLLHITYNEQKFDIEIQEKDYKRLVLNLNSEKYVLSTLNFKNNSVTYVFNQQHYNACFTFQPNGGLIISSKGFNFYVEIENHCYNPANKTITNNERNNNGSVNTNVMAPIPGKVSKIKVIEGDSVDKGAVLAIIESMKTENQLLASANARVLQVHVSEGEQIKANQLLFSLVPVFD